MVVFIWYCSTVSLQVLAYSLFSLSSHVPENTFVLHPNAIVRWLTFVYPCIASIIVNDDQQDATILAYLFIPNQLYMFRGYIRPSSEALDCIYSNIGGQYQKL